METILTTTFQNNCKRCKFPPAVCATFGVCLVFGDEHVTRSTRGSMQRSRNSPSWNYPIGVAWNACFACFLPSLPHWLSREASISTLTHFWWRWMRCLLRDAEVTMLSAFPPDAGVAWNSPLLLSRVNVCVRNVLCHLFRGGSVVCSSSFASPAMRKRRRLPSWISAMPTAWSHSKLCPEMSCQVFVLKVILSRIASLKASNANQQRS